MYCGKRRSIERNQWLSVRIAEAQSSIPIHWELALDAIFHGKLRTALRLSMKKRLRALSCRRRCARASRRLSRGLKQGRCMTIGVQYELRIRELRDSLYRPSYSTNQVEVARASLPGIAASRAEPIASAKALEAILFFYSRAK